jgi:hypothetical protein
MVLHAAVAASCVAGEVAPLLQAELAASKFIYISPSCQDLYNCALLLLQAMLRVRWRRCCKLSWQPRWALGWLTAATASSDLTHAWR